MMGDFVRAGGKPIPAFEQWLEAGMATGEKKHGAAWPQVYGRGAIHAFVFKPTGAARDGTALVGVIKPSHDSVGRKFPLTVFAQVPEGAIAAAPHLLPIQLGDFLEAATDAVHNVDGITSATLYTERIDRIPPPKLDFHRVTAEYDNWARATPLRAAWDAIYPQRDPDAGLMALTSIREAVSPFAGQENPT